MSGHDSELGPFEPRSDDEILAAIDRAALHTGSSEVWIVTIGQHLGFDDSETNRQRLRSELERLAFPGEQLVEPSGDRDREFWSLTGFGRASIRARFKPASDHLIALPESPQHRLWRRSQEEAFARLAAFRVLLVDVLQDAEGVAIDYRVRSSDVWFDLADRLRAAAWLVGSAVYCRDEWPEPDDAERDMDDNPGPLPGRRAVSAWDCVQLLARGR